MDITKYYADNGGNYKGGYCGATGIDTSAWIEVPFPPNDARQKWLNGQWLPLE